MRHFRYKNGEPLVAEREMAKRRALSDRAYKKLLRKEAFRAWLNIFIFLFFGMGGTFFGVWVQNHFPSAEGWLAFSVFLGWSLGFFVVGLLSKVQKPLVTLSPERAVKRQTCALLRRYYGFQEPFVLTKCFYAADEKFIGHDVCVFFTEKGFLHITADIYNGFLHAKSDLGCYEFDLEEVEVAFSEYQNNAAVTLRVDGKEAFVLCHRAGKFIKKQKTRLSRCVS